MFGSRNELGTRIRHHFVMRGCRQNQREAMRNIWSDQEELFAVINGATAREISR